MTPLFIPLFLLLLLSQLTSTHENERMRDDAWSIFFCSSLFAVSLTFIHMTQPTTQAEKQKSGGGGGGGGSVGGRDFLS